MEEIEALLAGSRARLSLFSTLHTLLGDRQAAVGFDLERRADRAEEHLRELKWLRERACVEAFTA